MARKILRDIEKIAAYKKRKCDQILFNQKKLSDEFSELQKEIQQINVTKSFFVSKINHPLFSNLQNTLLEEIITICMEYSNITICAKCLHLYPTIMLRENDKKSACFRHDVFLVIQRIF